MGKAVKLRVQAQVWQKIVAFYRCNSLSDLTVINYKVKILKFLKNLIYVSLQLFLALVIIITAFASWKECKKLRTNNYTYTNKTKSIVLLILNKENKDLKIGCLLYSKLVCILMSRNFFNLWLKLHKKIKAIKLIIYNNILNRKH